MTYQMINDLVELLMSEREDVRNQAFHAVEQLSGSLEGCKLISQCRSILSIVVGCIATAPVDDKTAIVDTALIILTNVATFPAGKQAISSFCNILIQSVIKIITVRNSHFAHRASGLLINLTGTDSSCSAVLKEITKDSTAFPLLVEAATNTTYNTAGNDLNNTMTVLQNMSSQEETRKLLLDRDQILLKKVLPFTSYKQSHTQRRAAVAVIFNCCFNKADHTWLLSESVDIASYICLPLSGSDGAYTEEENEKLSDMLVYLPDDKEREPELDIRILLLQALTQLCTTRDGREKLREQNVYAVLREMHKWETEHSSLVILEDLVNMLIRTEEEIGVEDISSVEVSEELHKKFTDLDVKSVDDSVKPEEKQ